MFSQDDDSTGVAMGVVFGVVALVISMVVGITIYQKNKSNRGAAAVATVVAPATSIASNVTDTQAAALVATGSAVVVVENGVVKFYFESGKFGLAEGGPKALTDIIAGVQAGKKALVSGYVDNTGNAAQNKEIAKKRAFEVRDLLKSVGVPEDKIELIKPQDIQAGSGPQARRVEVTLQ